MGYSTPVAEPFLSGRLHRGVHLYPPAWEIARAREFELDPNHLVFARLLIWHGRLSDDPETRQRCPR